MSRASKVLGRVLNEEDATLQPPAPNGTPADPYEGMPRKKLEAHAVWMRELEKAADKTLEVLRELAAKAREKETRPGADGMNAFERAERSLMTEIRSWADECKEVEHMASAEDHK